MSSLSLQYALCTAHVGTLLPTLCEAHAHDDAPHRTALATLIRLPCLHASGLSESAPTYGADAGAVSGTSRHFFELVCETEVRSWQM